MPPKSHDVHGFPTAVIPVGNFMLSPADRLSRDLLLLAQVIDPEISSTSPALRGVAWFNGSGTDAGGRIVGIYLIVAIQSDTRNEIVTDHILASLKR